jgi:hypothetical protein
LEHQLQISFVLSYQQGERPPDIVMGDLKW